ncbi:flavin reductase family protein [Thermococcus sp.]
MVGIVVSPKRYTHRLISRSGEFVVSAPSLEMLSDVWVAGKSGPAKLAEMGITLVPSTKIKTPDIKEALANLDCRVVDARDYCDHIWFVGELLETAYNEHEGVPNVRKANFLEHSAWVEFLTFEKKIRRFE